MRTPPQLDEKATVPKLELSQLKQTPSTPSPADPAPPAQPVPDAPTAAASAADEPAAEPEPVINAEAPAVIAASETPTPEKSTSQAAPEAQPEVQAEAPSNAAPTRAPSSNAAPAQAPSKAANKGHRGLLRLIPALLVAGVCVVGVLQRSGEAVHLSNPLPPSFETPPPPPFLFIVAVPMLCCCLSSHLNASVEQQEGHRGLNPAASCFPIPFLPLSRRVQAGQVLSQPSVPLIGTRRPGGQELLGAAISHLVRVLPQRPLGCLLMTMMTAHETLKQGLTPTCVSTRTLQRLIFDTQCPENAPIEVLTHHQP